MDLTNSSKLAKRSDIEGSGLSGRGVLDGSLVASHITYTLCDTNLLWNSVASPTLLDFKTASYKDGQVEITLTPPCLMAS